MFLIMNTETKRGKIVGEYVDKKPEKDADLVVLARGGVIVAESKKGSNTFSPVIER